MSASAAGCGRLFCVIPTGVRGAEGPRIFLNARHFDAVRAYEAAVLRVTNNLRRRVDEHKAKALPGFTATYHVDRLVWFEEFADAATAISREKQPKNWRRSKKIKLIESINPTWNELSAD